MKVQHIHPIGIGQSSTVEVGFNHIVAQLGCLVLNLRQMTEGKALRLKTEDGKIK